jgi:molybdopterin molybdotransferase
MPEFLELLPPAEALLQLLNAMPEATPQSELITTRGAFGRVLSMDIIAQEPLPPFTRSTVDGYALRAQDTHGASESLPTYLRMVGEVPMGSEPGFQIGIGDAAIIHTGGMLPNGADAVVMLEFTQQTGDGEVECLKAIPSGENVLLQGEDVPVGSVVLQQGKRLGIADIGGLTALGILEVSVAKAPRIAIISSGDEVVPADQRPAIGQVRDINSTTLALLIEKAGGVPVEYGIAPDEPDALKLLLSKALAECDAAVVTAGSSASARDLTAQIIHQMGSPGVLVHGVNVKPGKPTILAVCDGKPVVGLPGNPVSALVIAWLFVVPLIQHLLGEVLDVPRPVVHARLAVNIPSVAGREDYVPVRLNKVDGKVIAQPTYFKSNLIFSLSRSHGLVRIPPNETGLAAGSDVEVFQI